MSQRYLAVFSAAVLAAGLAGTAMAKPAHEFMKTAIQGDNSEVMLGKMAEDHASDPRVRDFGRMLEQDHSMAKQQAMPLAQRFGVRDTDAVAPQARAERRKLEHLQGRAFDREFVRYMVKDHKKDIHDFKEQARGHGAIADMARQTLPTLHKHLDTAEGLRG